MSKETILNYCGYTLPIKCGYEGAILDDIMKTVEMVYDRELKESEYISRDNLSIKQRAMFAMPYDPKKGYEDEYWHGRSVIEAMIAVHGEDVHGVMLTDEVIADMETFTGEESEIVETSHWDG